MAELAGVDRMAEQDAPQIAIPGIEVAVPMTKEQLKAHKESLLAAAIREVWDHYMLRFVRAFPSRARKPKLTDSRSALIDKSLKTYPKSDLMAAIDTMFDTRWRVDGGYYQLEAALKDAERIERLLAEADDPKLRNKSGPRGSVVPISRAPAAPIQPPPPNHQGYRARIHYTDDGIFDSQGRLIAGADEDSDVPVKGATA